MEAFTKLKPIVEQITDHFLAVLEGTFLEMSHVADVLNKLRDEITDRIAQASTPEEIEQLSEEIDELMSDYQKRLGKVMAEAKRLDKQGRR